MKPEVLEAKRTNFRPTGEKFVRITVDGCVQDTDMCMLKPSITRTVDVSGEIKVKSFQRLRFKGQPYLADVVTGTLYHEPTGNSGSPGLKIVGKMK